MPIEMTINTRLIADSVSDAKQQLIQLFGVALGEGVFVPNGSSPNAANDEKPVGRGIEALIPNTARVDDVIEALPLPGAAKRARRTKAQIAADNIDRINRMKGRE